MDIHKIVYICGLQFGRAGLCAMKDIIWSILVVSILCLMLMGFDMVETEVGEE